MGGTGPARMEGGRGRWGRTYRRYRDITTSDNKFIMSPTACLSPEWTSIRNLRTNAALWADNGEGGGMVWNRCPSPCRIRQSDDFRSMTLQDDRNALQSVKQISIIKRIRSTTNPSNKCRQTELISVKQISMEEIRQTNLNSV